MVSKSPAVTLEFRAFLRRLALTLRPTRVILFGSRARGDHRKDSDFDLLIVSPRFRRVPWIWRAPMVLRIWDLPFDVEAICLTPEEFRRRKNEVSIIGIAVNEGIKVYP